MVLFQNASSEDRMFFDLQSNNASSLEKLAGGLLLDK